MGLAIWLFALGFAYGALPAIIILLFQNRTFLQWYRQKPWLKVFLMASAATLIRLVIFSLTYLAFRNAWYPVLISFFMEVLVTAGLPGIDRYIEWYLGPQVYHETNQFPTWLLLITHVNFLFWFAVFSMITWRSKPTKPKTRPIRLIPPDRWAGRG